MRHDQPTGHAAGRAPGFGDGRERRRHLTCGALAALVATALLACSCGAGDDQNPGASAPEEPRYVNETVSDEQPQMGGQIVYGVPAETGSFNPVLAGWASYSLTIARAIYDTLTIYDESGKVQPFLAEKFEHSPDYRSWTVTLRDGVSYINGKPLTAESVVEYQRAVKASPVLGDTFARTESWEVKDRLTFVMHANQVWTSYPDTMSSQIGVAVDPDWLTSADITHPIGTGPFVVDHWDVNKEMVLKKNPKYWRKDEWGNTFPYLDQLTFRVMVDELARAEALRKGQIDLMMQNYATPLVGQMLDEAKEGRFQAFSDRKFETPEDYVVVNTTRPPLDQLDARKALAQAIDRKDYVDRVTGGLDEPADSPWAPGSPWYTEVSYPAYDLAGAQKLVEQVKARNGGRFAVTLLANQSNEATRVQQYLQEQWTKAGIEVQLQSVPQQTKIIKMLQADFDLTLTQQFDNVHPYNELIYWQYWDHPAGELSTTFSRLDDPELNTLCIEAAGSTGDTEKQKYGAAARRIDELLPYIWLAHASRSVIASTKLANVVRAKLPDGRPMLEFIQGSHPVYQIWIEH